jgi:hypothetical protein
VKKPWSKVKKGDRLDLGGRTWTVEKIKPGKKKAEVKIRYKSNVVRDTVKLADKVRIAADGDTQLGARYGKGRSQHYPDGKKVAPPPRKQMTRPPVTAHGDPWETQQDRLEKQLAKILGARLVGEATDPDAGYYVPPVDETTVAAHLALLHGTIDPTATSAEMLEQHAKEHAEHLAGERRFTQNHWHTEKRPTTGKKKKGKA